MIEPFARALYVIMWSLTVVGLFGIASVCLCSAFKRCR